MRGSGAYYNEFDPFAAAWLRNLIATGLIPVGDVDERSIADVQPDDLRGYTQCHFFAGIAGWAHGARLAGWPDDRPLWTGSCPCQPFSNAGKRSGTDDPRHLWPHFHRLIRACRPPVVMGEQVAGAAGYNWFDGVRADLEGEGYACRAVDIPACAVDAPHIRSRLYWIAVADTECSGREGPEPAAPEATRRRRYADGGGADGDVAESRRVGWGGGQGPEERHDADGPDAGRQQGDGRPVGSGEDDRRRGGDLADTHEQHDDRTGSRPGHDGGERRQSPEVRGRDAGRHDPSPLADTDSCDPGEHARVLRGHEGQHEERGQDGDHLAAADGGGRGEDGVANPQRGIGDRRSEFEERGQEGREAPGRTGAGTGPVDPVGDEWDDLPPPRARRGDSGSMADTDGDGQQQLQAARIHDHGAPRHDADRRSRSGDLGDTRRTALPAPERQTPGGAGRGHEGGAAPEPSGAPLPASGVAHAHLAGSGDGELQRGGQFGGAGGNPQARAGERAGDVEHATRVGRGEGWPEHELGSRGYPSALAGVPHRNGTFWSDAQWLVGADGKSRRAESCVRLLAHGIPSRVGRLRAYGNAVVPQEVEQVVAAFMETC